MLSRTRCNDVSHRLNRGLSEVMGWLVLAFDPQLDIEGDGFAHVKNARLSES
jgi:hypothetical protein